MKKIDREYMVGRRFGNWLVLQNLRDSGNSRHPLVLCRCSCGAEGKVDVHNLLRGMSRSCASCRGKGGSSNPNWKGFRDIPRNLFYIMTKSAAVRGITVEVTISDLQEAWERQGGFCALSGQAIKLGSKKLGITASVDRIDQARGYTKDNIQWVHKDVNLMKNRFSEEYFVATCGKIASHQRKRCWTSNLLQRVEAATLEANALLTRAENASLDKTTL